MGYGAVCWGFSVFATVSMLRYLAKFYAVAGPLGLTAIGLLALMTTQGLFTGLVQGEMRKLFIQRHKRLIMTLCLITVAAGALRFIPMQSCQGHV